MRIVRSPFRHDHLQAGPNTCHRAVHVEAANCSGNMLVHRASWCQCTGGAGKCPAAGLRSGRIPYKPVAHDMLAFCSFVCSSPMRESAHAIRRVRKVCPSFATYSTSPRTTHGSHTEILRKSIIPTFFISRSSGHIWSCSIARRQLARSWRNSRASLQIGPTPSCLMN